MGSCVSRSTASVEGSGRAVATAKVVGPDGSLAQFAAPVMAGEALGDAASASSFLCSADELRFDAPARALAAEEALQPGWLSGLHEKGPRPEPPSGCVLGPANPSNPGVLGPENMSPSSSPEEETPSSTEVEEHPSSRPISTTAATADPSSPSTSPSLTLPQGHLPSPLRTAGRPSAIA
ncbi:ankyrin repeat and SAM domain-containing protein 6 [Triticum aestivum]|uniref:ankyrin repeat and SAM domain-containing protein 6 n=1 Tax=Triticum aestivum TaxID=4565 RepID=UPI001D0206C3|nr:ankyrin repeat and SAM domain-containing protein 6-like [Triticum aestivum]